MAKRITPVIVAMLLAALLAPAVIAKPAAELLREGLYAEEVEGNLDSAIGIYRQIVSDASAPRNLVAQALYHQGTCLMKKKQDQEAQAAFRRIITDYSDQTEIVEKVRPMLDELGNADPASLMPPETFAYIEIGSPGMQVETILNMLKGTPMENPLAAIGAGGNQGEWGGGNNPAQMLGALLNPSTLAEFKKIRGLGVGIVDLAQNGPPAAIVVLFPGKSDALRGLLMMVIGMVGKPAEGVEGMSAVTFPTGGGAAYDDNVVIVATPSPKAKDLLQWAVRQYQGKSSQPSLATSNKAFVKISKQARQQNALTVWVNADETYDRLGKMLPADEFPNELRAANGLANFKNVDDVLVTLSLRETGIALEGNVAFKNGSQSQVYSLIRTPNLNKAALKAIPADAVALISVALGGAGSAQAQALGEKIKAATGGQDFASQIFGNVEQITLFAMPLKDLTQPDSSGIPPIVRSVGLAVSCKNPQQVQQLLMKVLQMAKAVPAPTEAEAAAPTAPAAGRFEIALTNGPKLFGYTDPASQTMLLSLNPQMLESSLTAMKQNASVTSGGKLQEPLATLSPTTSKLILVNVAGAIQLISQNMHLPSDEMSKQAHQSLDELIQACQKTTVRLQTNEEPNDLDIRLSVSDLPPLNQVFGPIRQISQIIDEAKGGMAGGWPEKQIPLSIAQASKAPTIDGNVDDVWTAAELHAIDHTAYAPASSEADLSAGFKALWDNKALYVLVDVTDDQLVNDSTEYYLDDSVEVFIDADHCRANTYGDKDYQYHFDWDATAPAMGESHHNKTAGVQYALIKTDKGYRVEIEFPWSTLGVTPAAGTKIGLDVHVNDDDDGGDRDTKLMWCATDDISWQRPSALCTAELAGLIGWWKLDETEGTKVADSSGNGHDGTTHGDPAWQPQGGKVGGALLFDGKDDYVDTGYATDLALWTVAAWVKSPAAPSNADPGGPVHREKNFQINWNHPVEAYRGAAALCIGGNWLGASFGELKPDTWYHLAATFDGKSLRAYKNGVLVATNSEASGRPDPETETLKFGKHASDDFFFAGVVDDVHLYNFALPDSQITQLCQGK